jgi:hypothetical protein
MGRETHQPCFKKLSMTYILSTWDPEPEKCITPGIDGITTHKLPGLDLILTNFSVVDLPYEINITIFDHALV